MANKYLRSTSSIEFLAEGYLDEASTLDDEPVESALFYVDQDTGTLYIRVPGVDDEEDTWVAQGALWNVAADQVSYDNAVSGLVAATVQAAIDEVYASIFTGVEVAEADGAPDVPDVTRIEFDGGAVVTDDGGGQVTVTVPEAHETDGLMLVDPGTVGYVDTTAIETTLVTPWGYDGTPYFDDEDGAADGDEAALYWDRVAGVYCLVTYDFP